MKKYLTDNQNYKTPSIQDALKVSYWKLALPLSASIMGGLYCLEQWRPWQIDVDLPLST